MVISSYIHPYPFMQKIMNNLNLEQRKENAVNSIQNYLQLTGRQILDPHDVSLDRIKIRQLFDQLSVDMSNEDKLFPTNGETLMASWELGHSSAIYDPVLNRIVSHARLAQSTTHELNSQLDLPQDTPRVFELGTVYTIPELRGDVNHTSTITILNLYNIFCRLHCDEHIIIGTLTNAKVAKLMSKSINFGIRTVLVNHNEDALGALTCVCEPEQPLGGSGHHHGLNACTVRTSKSGIRINTDELTQQAIEHEIEIAHDGDLDDGSCFMFVAGTNETLNIFHANIINRFGINSDGAILGTEQTMNNFISALNSINYYGSALTSVNEHES